MDDTGVEGSSMQQESGSTGVKKRARSRLGRAMAHAGTAIGMAWASPLTLFGLLLAIPALIARDGKLSLIRHRTPALLVTGPLVDRVLSRHPLGGVTAMALGHLVIAKRHELSTRLLEHELTHVRQAARWGIAFPVAYCAASVWQQCRGRRAYWDNVFEVDARNAERHAEPERPAER